MPRMARIAPRGHVFHVLTRGNNRQDVFLDTEDYQTYLDILNKYKEKFECKIYHYVLMTNHVHLVLETLAEGGSLAEVMKGINLSYAQHFKRRYDHIGHFWQDRFKSILISKDRYLLACGSYVELNPVRAGLVKDPRDYRLSSYNSYAYGKEDTVVDEHPIYQGISRDEAGRRRKYREFVMGRLRAGNGMRGEMNRRVIYGDKTFTAKISKEYRVAEVTRMQGRPRKKG